VLSTFRTDCRGLGCALGGGVNNGEIAERIGRHRALSADPEGFVDALVFRIELLGMLCPD
jgi:hypothetical protein